MRLCSYHIEEKKINQYRQHIIEMFKDKIKDKIKKNSVSLSVIGDISMIFFFKQKRRYKEF